MNDDSEVAPAPPRDPAGAPDDDASTERLARWTFAGLAIVALVFFLVAGRHAWFWFDEWEFLAGRSLSVHDLLEQHGGQLVAPEVQADGRSRTVREPADHGRASS